VKQMSADSLGKQDATPAIVGSASGARWQSFSSAACHSSSADQHVCPSAKNVGLRPRHPAGGMLLGTDHTGRAAATLAGDHVALMSDQVDAARRQRRLGGPPAGPPLAFTLSVIAARFRRATVAAAGPDVGRAKRPGGRCGSTVEADIFAGRTRRAGGRAAVAGRRRERTGSARRWCRSATIAERGRPVAQAHRPTLFTIEGVRDEYATLCPCRWSVKHRAAIDMATEIADARAHLVRLKLDRYSEKHCPTAMSIRTSPCYGLRNARQVAEADDRALANGPEPIAVEIERPQAEFASWYELFPRRSARRRRHQGQARASRTWLRRLYFPADPSDSARQPQGSQQRPQGRPDIPAVPMPSAARGWARCDSSGAGHAEDFRRLVAAASEPVWRSHSTSASSAAFDHPWLKEHPQCSVIGLTVRSAMREPA